MDLFLGDISDPPRSLCIFLFPVPAPSADRVLDILADWDRSQAAVEVIVRDGRRGPEVTISSDKAELVLEPAD